MIGLTNLPKIKDNRKKRLGRGHGSGRGKTAGRGTKGQKARGTISSTITGSYLSMVKRLPLIRGKYRNKPFRHKPLTVNIKYLNIFKANDVVDKESLIAKNIITKEEADKYHIKILGEGLLKIPLVVKLACSNGAVKKITSVGGKIENGKAAQKKGKKLDTKTSEKI